MNAAASTVRNPLTLAPSASECDMVAHAMVADARWSLVIAGGRLMVYIVEGKTIRPISFKIGQLDAALATAPKGEAAQWSSRCTQRRACARSSRAERENARKCVRHCRHSSRSPRSAVTGPTRGS